MFNGDDERNINYLSVSDNIRSRNNYHGITNVNKIKQIKKNNQFDDDYKKINDNKRKRSQVEKTTCTENVQQYLLNSSLHGLRYVGERNISLFERTFFMLSFILVLLLSGYFISNVWDKWSGSPVIITLNSKSTSINDIPFPAVTICNMNQAKKSKVINIKAGTSEDTLLQSLCTQGDITTVLANTTTTNNTTGKWETFREFILNVAQPCSELILLCRFASEEHKCTQLFDTTLTDEGICCTFNSVDKLFLLQKFNDTIDDFDSEPENEQLIAVDWTPENGYPSDLNKNLKNSIYPRPTSAAGSNMGLFVILNTAADDYYCSTTNCVGFKFLLHNPTETPKISEYGLTIGPGQETRVVITPKISDASNAIQRVPKLQRQCVFANEGNLTYFRTYSRKNCEMECESRIVEAYCGCVLYFMPQTKPATNICNRKDWNCYAKIKLAIDLSLNDTYQCKCLPGCFEISYGTELSSAKLNFDKYLVREQFLLTMDPDFIKKNVAVLYIYYTESFFRSYTREELIGFTEFLSNTGGLLGLFMGFSVVSLIEILYFLSLRPFCARKRYTNYVSKVKLFEEPSIGKKSQKSLTTFNNDNQKFFNNGTMDNGESTHLSFSILTNLNNIITSYFKNIRRRSDNEASGVGRDDGKGETNKIHTINNATTTIHYPYTD